MRGIPRAETLEVLRGNLDGKCGSAAQDPFCVFGPHSPAVRSK